MGGIGSGRFKRFKASGMDENLLDASKGLKSVRAGVVLEVARKLPDMPEELREELRKRNTRLSEKAFTVAMRRLDDMMSSARARQGIRLSEINDTVFAGALLEIGLAGTKEERLRAEGASREQIAEALTDLRKLKEDKANIGEMRKVLQARMLALPAGGEDGVIDGEVVGDGAVEAEVVLPGREEGGGVQVERGDRDWEDEGDGGDRGPEWGGQSFV